MAGRPRPRRSPDGKTPSDYRYLRADLLAHVAFTGPTATQQVLDLRQNLEACRGEKFDPTGGLTGIPSET